MRVAPLGAFFAEEPPSTIVRESILSAQVTHFNREAEAGAAAIALTAAHVTAKASRGEPLSGDEMVAFVVAHTPDSDTKRAIATALGVPRQQHLVARAAEVLGNGSKTTCVDTVPFVIWCAATAVGPPRVSFNDAMWMTLSAGGDRDTNCAMVGGVIAAVCSDAELREWMPLREPLMTPCWPEIPSLTWPLGPPLKGKELHPCCPHTEYL
eukprot:TRINITY_DN1574_c0_g1_i2.p1 TRINITY_DN1574_c0_g1~~TRINITY_DN1574_c0_g1_i2.p1  ORF type:complete len:230 (-),score=70.23 TRINITY_DN1574_c0_g1_i2:65-694(-)